MCIHLHFYWRLLLLRQQHVDAASRLLKQIKPWKKGNLWAKRQQCFFTTAYSSGVCLEINKRHCCLFSKVQLQLWDFFFPFLLTLQSLLFKIKQEYNCNSACVFIFTTEKTNDFIDFVRNEAWVQRTGHGCACSSLKLHQVAAVIYYMSYFVWFVLLFVPVWGLNLFLLLLFLFWPVL